MTENKTTSLFSDDTNSFTEIKNLINNNTQDGVLTLKANQFKSKSIMEILASFFGEQTLKFKNLKTITDTTEKLKIKAKLKNNFLGGSNLKTKLTFTSVNNNDELKVRFSDFPQKWKFSNAFPQFKNSFIDTFVYGSPAFRIDSQKRHVLPQNYRSKLGFKNALPVDATQIKDGLSFSASIALNTLSKDLRWLLEDAEHTTLKLSGPIEIIQNFPVLWFKSDKGKSLNILGKELPLELELASIRTDKNIQQQKGDTTVFGQVTSAVSYDISSGKYAIPFQARFFMQNITALQLYADAAESAIALKLNDLASLAGIKDADALIPKEFPLTSIQLIDLGGNILVDHQKIQDTFVTIGSNDIWQPFGKWLTFNGFKVKFSTGFTSDSAVVTAFTTATVFGKDIEASIWLPDLGFSMALSQGEVIEIGQMLSDLSIRLPGLDNTTCSAFNLSGNISKSFYSAMCRLENVWKLDMAGVKLDITEIIIQLNYSKQGSSAYLEGRIMIDSTGFQLIANNETGVKGWLFIGKTLSSSPISLQSIAAGIGKLVGVSVGFPLMDIDLKSGKVEIDTEKDSFKFYANTDIKISLPFLGSITEVETVVNLESLVDAKTKKRTYSGYFESQVLIGKAAFAVRFDISQNVKRIVGSWNSVGDGDLSLDDIASFLRIDNVVEIPSGLDLSLTAATFAYDVSLEQFTLTAASKQYGNAFFTAGRDSKGAFGFVFGVNFDDCPKFSSIPVVGQYLKPADFLKMKTASIILTKGVFNNYTLPPLPELSAKGTGAGNPPAIKNATLNLATGVSLGCEVDMAETGNDNAIIKNLNTITGQGSLLLQVAYTVTTASAKSMLQGSVTIPTGGSGLTISNPAVELDFTPLIFVKLAGNFSFALNGVDVLIRIVMTLAETQASVSGSVQTPDGSLPAPPGLKGLHMNELSLLMGVFFAPPSIIFGLGGKFTIGEVQTKDDEFSFVLQIIEAVPNPLYLSFYVDKMDMATMVTLFTDKQPAPAEMKNLELVTASNISFYWAETSVALPDGTTAIPGFAFSGEINIFGFKMFANCEISQNSGINGKAQSNPINLQHILVIKGNGEAVKRKVDGNSGDVVSNKQTLNEPTNVTEKTIVDKGGPHFEISTTSSPFLVANWKISLFDIVNEQVDISVGFDEVAFNLNYSISGIDQFILKNTLKNFNDYTGEAVFSLGVDQKINLSKAGVHLGTIHLVAKVGAVFKAAVNLKEALFSINNMGFNFMGQDLVAPDITLSKELPSLKGLPQTIIDGILDNADTIFYAYISDPLIFAKHVFDKGIAVAEDVGNLLKTAYSQRANDVAKTMKDAGYNANKVASSLESAFGDSTEIIGNALAYAGYGYSSVITALFSIGKTGEEIGDYLNKLGLPIDTIKTAISNVADVPGDVLNEIGEITHIY